MIDSLKRIDSLLPLTPSRGGHWLFPRCGKSVKYISMVLFILFGMRAFTQVYPYKDGFSTDPAGQPPPGWSGDAVVYLNHGDNGARALAGHITSIFTEQNSITPVIGSLTPHSVLTFYYRVVDQYIYPSTGTTYYAGDSFNTQLSVNGGAYQTVLAITDSNHTPDLNFVQQKVYIGGFVGDTVHIQFNFIFGGTGGGYYVDIDSMAVYEDPTAAIGNVDGDLGASIFPNPAAIGQGCTVHLDNTEHEAVNMEIFDAVGRSIYRNSVLNPSGTHIGLDWPVGLYYIRLNSKEKTVTRKLVIE